MMGNRLIVRQIFGPEY
uniref:Uncharacterized protein n=1 Tax=Anguilla anguilla TaxID=7936 RepID=A0A0E9R8G4_ANGAN